MKRFIFGFDAANPEACAAGLRERGVDAVVIGAADPRTARALEREDLELYLCYGAFSLGTDFDAAPHLPEDARGRAARWFGSGCPNDPDLAAARLTAALSALRDAPTARGLFVDGARFASFASSEGPDAFFTCFCPRCLRRMEALGFDAGRMRAAAERLWRTRRIPEADAPALRDWFAFRRACVKQYFDDFAAAVHALPGNRLAAGFVFAASLGGFVGQTPESWAALDLVSPMLYRAYPHADGPACLGHEWAAARSLFDAATLRALARLAGEGAVPVPEETGEALRANGFAPDRVGTETALARSRLRGGQKLMPILQIEDTRLGESVAAARAAGADGIGLFMYGMGEADFRL